ncbi:MAG: T9SS type A sorting domain-containing protein [Bacteroidetes bacterium]|nr:T9SS type A sorting domain-containing protein [Bacteroidota bacterium]
MSKDKYRILLLFFFLLITNLIEGQNRVRIIDAKLIISKPAPYDTFYSDNKWHKMTFWIKNLGQDTIFKDDYFNYTIFINYTAGAGGYYFQSTLLPGDSTISHTSFITKGSPWFEVNNLCIRFNSGLHSKDNSQIKFPPNAKGGGNCIPIIFHIPDRTKFYDDLPYTDTVYYDSINRYSLSIFPNPFNNYIDCQLKNDSSELQSVKIMDMKGEVWSVQNTKIGEALYRIDLSNLAKGLYVVEIFFDNEIIRTKMVKE